MKCTPLLLCLEERVEGAPQNLCKGNGMLHDLHMKDRVKVCQARTVEEDLEGIGSTCASKEAYGRTIEARKGVH